jgi:cytochrome c556
MKPLHLGIATALIAGAILAGQTAFPAAAQTAATNAGEIVKVRKDHMKSMGNAMKAIAAYVKNEGGTIDDVRRSASVIQDVSQRVGPGLFPAGTGMGEFDTAAKPEIWQRWSDFTGAADKLKAESAKMVEVSKKDDRATIAPQFGALGKACGGCHDNFRQKKE